MNTALYLGVPLLSLATIAVLQFTGSVDTAREHPVGLSLVVGVLILSVVGLIAWSSAWLAVYAAGCVAFVGLHLVRRARA